ncbi:hypothetical protein NIES2135_53620 [Leptolyngbya boryana NIES-2135]|jgi:hypothetical protein|uniref:Uncharacterized protein n=1 Tax=Leptolyngbya boryana NIES-2135 TaxID=1973484 RepID=A0A1Z4JP42_LEPBY|nr:MULTISPECIES: hypothetical protein [Leptolyngbya]BAY58489.1 hypothetical protein NIES2135_53620 [Leptolyngbya boryana NIES-2135]MBD2370964.1 hypothetical protein [Leptolyngbya sp. FACHB-161]MBD2377478.1 hypothetical protein [Leptolyngbya sp. FACHB-238]MBD2401886.1 hypothetical protein [Leptolyngbya sp. FACHB-239]MBD2408404.1 hypothetical protein [Leptolyngbya sp. FACHB-402]
MAQLIGNLQTLNRDRRVEVSHTLGKITAIQHGYATTYTLEWSGHYLGETVQGADKLFYVGTGQGYTLPEVAHYLLIQFLDKIRLSNEWAFNQLMQQESLPVAA